MIQNSTIESLVQNEEAEEIVSVGVFRALRLKTANAVIRILNEEPNEWCTKMIEYAENYIRKHGELILVLQNGCLFALGSQGSKEMKSVRNRVISASMAKELHTSGILTELKKKGVLTAGVFPSEVSLEEEINEIQRENDRYADFRTIFFHITPRSELIKNARWAFYFAYTVIRGPFIKGEPIIASNPLYAYLYARYVIHKRFHLGEKTIIQDDKYRPKYIKLLTRLGFDPYTIYIIEHRNQNGAKIPSQNPVPCEIIAENDKPKAKPKTNKKRYKKEQLEVI